MMMGDDGAAPGNVPTTTSGSGTARRLSILKKFGSALVRNSGVGSQTPTSGSSSPAMSMGNDASGSAVSKPNVLESGALKVETKTSMLPPPPPPPLPPVVATGTGGEIGGSAVSSGNGSTMRRLLEDLHRSRQSYDQDKRAYDKARLGIQDVDAKVAKLKMESDKAKENFGHLGEMAAVKRTDLNAVEIRSKVVDGTSKKVEQELKQVLDELHKTRIETAELSSAYLTEAVRFGLQWNGTEMGRMNRIQFDQQEIENLEREKRQLEFELADFLVLQKGVQELEKDVDELNQRYKEVDEFHYKQELDLQKRVQELDTTLNDLEYEEKEFQRSSFEELEQLQKQINEVQNSINSLQKESAEAKATAKTQKNVNKGTQNKDSKTVESGQIQLGEGAPVARNTSYESKITARDEQNLNSCDNKSRFTRFQVPVKPQLQSRNSYGSSKNSFNTSRENNSDSSYFDEFEGFPQAESNNNDDDTYLAAAAAEVSQSLRGHEPVAPKSTYGPPPTKVRGVERQTPITQFMKQVSSARVIKRPPKKNASQLSQGRNKNKEATKPAVNHVAPIRTSVPSSGKTFQFKKKLSFRSNSNPYDKENSMLSDSNMESSFQNEYDCPKAPSEEDNLPEPFDERPFSRFNSSRILFTDTQEQHMEMG